MVLAAGSLISFVGLMAAFLLTNVKDMKDAANEIKCMVSTCLPEDPLVGAIWDSRITSKANVSRMVSRPGLEEEIHKFLLPQPDVDNKGYMAIVGPKGSGKSTPRLCGSS
jgi:hypothetical protein